MPAALPAATRPVRGVGVRNRGTIAPATPRRPRRRRARRVVLAVLLVAAVLLAPVPWRHHLGPDPMGLAWRLDGRLVVDGRTVAPPGRWSWVTVGRPPLVAEVLAERLRPGGGPGSQDLRERPIGYDPGAVEPVAAAVGLRHAGVPLELTIRVEVRGPVDDRYPETGEVVSIDGIALTDRAAWELAAAPAGGPRRFTLETGEVLRSDGPDLPYATVRVVDVPPDGFEAALFGNLPDLAVVRWARGLALGPSHGLMVALATYADAAGVDPAGGRHVAGTGGVRGDGTVTRIGGLPAKLRAAHRAGAEVFVFPASQADELHGPAPDGLVLLPVETVAEAIELLGTLPSTGPASDPIDVVPAP